MNILKKLSLVLLALLVVAAAIWLGITSLHPFKHKAPFDTAAPRHGLELTAFQPAPGPGSPTPVAGGSPSPPSKESGSTPDQPPETPPPSPTPAATIHPSSPLAPQKKALAASMLPKESSPPLLASAFPPAVPGSSVPAIKQQADQPPVEQAYNNSESSNFEPTTLTVMRTFVLTLPGGGQVEQSVSIPVLYRRGSIALKADQLEQLGAIQAQVQRILDANEELRVAADLLITKQRKLLAGSVPGEVLSARSSSVLPGGPIRPGANYVNVPQGAVEIEPATKEP
jgi:hypothetical protein